MLILVIGDVIGKPGRQAIRSILSELKKQYQIDLVIANGENSAGGIGITPDTAEDLLRAGVDIITSGNHIWRYNDIIPYLDQNVPLLRPLNYPPGLAGRGYLTRGRVMVVNLIGRVFINNFDCPFRAMDKLLADVTHRPSIIIVDFHAEATSEKVALGKYLDGRVSALVGTHTHVGTIDARLLPRGTAYITDIGMVGPLDSVIGDDADSVIQRFLTMMPHRISVGKGKVLFNSVLINVNEESGKALSIERIDREVEE
jgi:2',3'-cyclic-nucleotide 2'-phosphodiesterase